MTTLLWNHFMERRFTYLFLLLFLAWLAFG